MAHLLSFWIIRIVVKKSSQLQHNRPQKVSAWSVQYS